MEAGNIQANITPIPAFRENNKWLVFIHISFVKVNSDKSLGKITFDDYPMVKAFFSADNLPNFTIKASTGDPKGSGFALKKPLPRYWNLFDTYTLDEKINKVKLYHNDDSLQYTVDQVDGQIRDIEANMAQTKNRIATTTKLLRSNNKNIEAFNDIITDISQAILNFKTEFDSINKTEATYKKELGKYNNRLQKYVNRKAGLQTLVVEENTSNANDRQDLTRLQGDLDLLKQARSIFVNFKNERFVSANQENAVKIITDYLKGDAKSVPPPAPKTKYTSDVDHLADLTLTDVLAYFTGYPDFLQRLGLLIKVDLDDGLQDTQPGKYGKLTVTCTQEMIGDIALNLHTTRYEISNATSYFFPPSKDTSGRYKDGYLNLGLTTNNNSEYALLQNNFEDIINKQPTTTAVGDDRDSNHTSGFFLTQNSPKNDLNTSQPDGDLCLEDLLVGYRIDVKRLVTGETWKSLNHRYYSFQFTGSESSNINDEGFISSNSATRGYELALYRKKISTDDKDPTIELDEINLYDSTNIPSPCEVIVSDNTTIWFTLILSDKSPETFSYDPVKKALIIKSNHGLKLDVFVSTINSYFSDKANKVAFINRLLQVDKKGRLYYSGFTTQDIQDLPSYIPSSIICHITGDSLNAPRRMGQKLIDAFNGMVSDSSLGIEDFMRKGNVSLKIDTPDHSLPLLRIGDNYKVRCRLTLLGGIGLDVKDSNEKYFLPAPYLRQDPIHAPMLVFGEEYDENGICHSYQEIGDSEQQIIIRDSIVDAIKYPLTSRRFITPPSINWKLAEALKMMDDNTGKPDALIFLNTKQLKRPQYFTTNENNPSDKIKITYWKYNTGRYGKYLTNIDTRITPYIVDAMADYFLIEPTAVYCVDRYEIDQQKHRLVNLDFSKRDDIAAKVRTEAAERLKSLQDMFRGNFVINKIPQCKFWPNPSRKSTDSAIVWTLLVNGSGTDKLANDKTAVRIDNVRHVITITIQKGEDIEFTIRCFTDKSQLAKLKYGKELADNDKFYPWMKANAKTTLFAERRFRAIYALMKPWNPHLDDIQRNELFIQQQFIPSRSVKYPQDVVIEQGIHFVGRTASEIYLIAEWDEIFDDVPKKNITTRDSSPLRIKRNHRKVFAYNSPGFFGVKTDHDYSFHKEKQSSPFCISNENDAEKRIYADLEGINLVFRHELGSSKFHSIRYYMVGESRFKSYYQKLDITKFDSERTEYFSANKAGDTATKVKDFRLNATQAPLLPDVAFIVPLFYDSPVVQDAIQLQRNFKGLRVYLNRPWYSSGYGELLAVILEDPNFTQRKSDYLNWVSQIGRDITTQDDSHIVLKVGEFLDTPEFRQWNSQYNMSIETGNSESVKPVLFPVYFDTTQHLWYADITFTDVAYDSYYCPFVRLVLARFQPFSEKDTELSRPVICDFMQLYPNRTITIDIASHSITVRAPSFKKDATGTSLTEIRFWPVNRSFPFSATGYLLTEDDFKSGFGTGTLDGSNFTYTCAKDCKAVIIREYEFFDNTDKTIDSPDYTARRLLYTHVVNLPSTFQ